MVGPQLPGSNVVLYTLRKRFNKASPGEFVLVAILSKHQEESVSDQSGRLHWNITVLWQFIYECNCRKSWHIHEIMSISQYYNTHKTKGATDGAGLAPCKLTGELYTLGSLWELHGIHSIAPKRSQNGPLYRQFKGYLWYSSRWSHCGSTYTNLRELLREPREPYVCMAPLAPSKAPLVLCV